MESSRGDESKVAGNSVSRLWLVGAEAGFMTENSVSRELVEVAEVTVVSTLLLNTVSRVTGGSPTR